MLSIAAAHAAQCFLRLQEKCRQQRINEVQMCMHKLQLIDHPDVTFHEQVITTYDHLNNLCFDGRLPFGNDIIHWSQPRHMHYGGCMFGAHGVVVGIVLRADETTMPELFETLVHEMVHADIERRQIPIGRRCHGRHFKQEVKRVVEAIQRHLQMFQNMVGTELKLDAKRMGHAKFTTVSVRQWHL